MVRRIFHETGNQSEKGGTKKILCVGKNDGIRQPGFKFFSIISVEQREVISMEDTRSKRKEAGFLTMADAARSARTPYRTWQDWEAGKSRTPGVVFSFLELAEKLARYKANEVGK